VRVPWLVEREEAVQRLRDLCREFGDLDWTEHMHLADVIDKHLGNHLRAAKTGRGR
jgi:predicted secreted protein